MKTFEIQGMIYKGIQFKVNFLIKIHIQDLILEEFIIAHSNIKTPFYRHTVVEDKDFRLMN